MGAHRMDRPLRAIGRRRFLASAAGAAAAGGAGLLGRRAWGGSKTAISEYPLDDAAGPPSGIRLGVRRVIWSVETREPVVALTFDDGPDPELTPQILDILDRFNLKATFFVIGYNVVRQPDLAVEVAHRGHEIGNHTWTHVDLTRQPPDEARWQLTLCQKAIADVTGTHPKYFRPPRGLLSGTAARYAAESDSDVVLWSVGRAAAGGSAPAAIASHTVDATQPGDIVLLHDGIGREALRTDLDGDGPIRRRRGRELAALPRIIEGILSKGLRPTTVSGLLAAAEADRPSSSVARRSADEQA